ncbi:MAG TPA: response regulator [Tepidisphaeraceae bacterium]|jgi:CheY-like chemotaxis protein|nr:response regulator [Tepidisphaeraceae bacterium]
MNGIADFSPAVNLSERTQEEEPHMAKILVVDDDSGCRRLTSRILTAFGYASVLASNGVEALDVLRREDVDLILLDLMMPEMDGLTFMRVMRGEAKWANVPVLVLSGVADLEVANTVRETGVQGYLVKSRYSIDDLLGQVRRYIAPGSSPQSSN